MALTDNLKAYWKLNWDSNDSWSNWYNWTDSNVSYVSGKISDCGSFNWSSSIISLSNSAWFSGNAARTINCWVKLDTLSHNNAIYYIFSNWANDTSNDFSFGICDSASSWWLANQTTLYVRRYYDDQASADIRSYLDTTNWFMLTVTYNWVSTWTDTIWAWLRFYLNGTEINRSSNATYMYDRTFNTSQENVRIWWTNLYTSYFDWLIDEIWLWSRALTSTEITALYNSGNWLTYPFTWWTFIPKIIQF